MCKEKKKRVNVTFSEGVLLSIDSHARAQGLSRSAYLSKLENDVNARIYLQLDKYKNPDSYFDLDITPDNPLYED